MAHANRVKLNEVTVRYRFRLYKRLASYTCLRAFSFKGRFKSLPVTVTHLSESGGTFIEPRLTWDRLNAELKNWRKVGRESLAFLEKNGEAKKRRILKCAGMGGESRTDGEHYRWIPIRQLNREKMKGGERTTRTHKRLIERRQRLTEGLDVLIESDK